MANKIVLLVSIMLLATVSGCANYQFGDVSRVYCGSTNEEIRADIKIILKGKGISIGVDYCSSVGLVDALLLQPMQNNQKKHK